MRALDPGEDAPGKSFEIRVANAYRALGYQVTHNVDLRGKQTDLLARLTPPGSPSITLAIECKDHQAAVGNKIVSDFVSTIIRQRSDNAVTSGALVSSRGFTAKGRAVAADYPYITLLSWDDLTAEVIEVRAQMEQLVARYESEPIYGEYLSLNAEVLSWGNLMGPSTKTNALTSLIHEWIQRGAELAAPNALFVLGDFGSGKTTLLRHLEYERARQYLCGQDLHIPLYVTLRNYRDTYDIPQLLRASFRDAYYRDVPSELVWQRIQDGLFYVLLDGFDEMIDRSDAGRRLELFYSLTGILRSPSPTIITSRPSYFVERGELDDILATLRLEESAIADRRISTSGGASTAADRIRRKLLARRREIQPPLRAYDPLRTQDVGVARLMPLDREQIKAYLNQRAHEMEAVNVTPHAVADFIDRTYDLADLASRPLLLTLIVDSVIDGVLDADDTGTQYGPSGLYEIYTQAKLDLDMSKGRSRREGLSSEARRVLAEAVAIEMYQSQTLEVDLHKTLSGLLGTPGIEFDHNNLSRDEIVTDFATCSFVTLDDEGKCRFVHKSFRGFFIARNLRESLRHPLFSEWLEREILYFLGGFAPTQPRVSERLWGGYLHSDINEDTLRRNMLVAYLFTKPEHDSRKIANADIADSNFNRLIFRRPRHSKVNWREVEIRELVVDGGDWDGVQFVDCRLGRLSSKDCAINAKFHNTLIDVTHLNRIKGEIGIVGCTVGECVISDSSIVLHDDVGGVGRLVVEASALNYAQLGRQGNTTMELHGSRVVLSGCSKARLRASECIATLEPDCRGGEWWTIERSAVRVMYHNDEEDDSRAFMAHKVDDATVLLANGAMSYKYLTRLRCGVFGELQSPSIEAMRQELPSAWGVMYVENGRQIFERPVSLPFLHGNTLIVSREWYADAMVPGGELSVVQELERLCSSRTWEGREVVPDGHVDSVLGRVREQYQLLTKAKWPIFAAFFRDRA